MSKSHAQELVQVYRCLFQDIKYAYPTLERELDRDLATLERLAVERGLHLMVKDLPAAGKHFDRCLSEGQYTRSGLPLTKRYSSRVVIPKFLRGLYLLVFSEQGRLKDDADAQAVFLIRQVYLLAKKAELPSSDRAIFHAMEEFFLTDSLLPEPEPVWADESATSDAFACYEGFIKSEYYAQKLLAEEDDRKVAFLERLLRSLDFVTGYLTTSLGPYQPEEWSFRHGPGAISEATGIIDKYSWRCWPKRLENAYPIADFGFHNHAAWAANDKRWVEEEIPSRLIAVPKTYEKPRLIAAEPMANQWCQQNIWHYMSSRAAHCWIDDFVRFRDQSRNQLMCLEGSRTGRLATVDLSSASDRVTCHLVGQAFRRNPGLLLHLQACRTRRVGQKSFGNLPREADMRKFSTMGSAVTFPVQSLLFMSVAIATILVDRGMAQTPSAVRSLVGEVTVYGDDIVIPSDSRVRFTEALEFLDFKVNEAKTFSTGWFRESCGVDAFRGDDVSPVYWKSSARASPESIAGTLETLKNFYKKFLITTSGYLLSTIQRKFPLVPVDSGVLSVPSFVKPPLSGFRTRWNEALQRLEVKVPVFSSRTKTRDREDDSALHQYFTDEPSPHDPWRAGVPQRSATKLRSGWVSVDEVFAQD